MIKLKIKYGNSQTDLRFPCTEKEMNAALERIHAEDVTPLELYVPRSYSPRNSAASKTDSPISMKSTTSENGWTAFSAMRNISFTRR